MMSILKNAGYWIMLWHLLYSDTGTKMDWRDTCPPPGGQVTCNKKQITIRYNFRDMSKLYTITLNT